MITILFFIFEEGQGRIALAAGQEPQFSGRIFSITRVFTVYSTVPASGTSRRDPPRHGVFGAHIFSKKGLM